MLEVLQFIFSDFWVWAGVTVWVLALSAGVQHWFTRRDSAEATP